ncbi:tubulin-tyrosine ligase family protein [Babesia caballi]|uniref:Tubulin-tyrosine ligase family protein n=1 Tax=Babesia caballi TaxID=5871 RepID=A0AAV4LMV3_BABCB|nr:tubulin-tyrosine ligase family protein [Babesia caballi]
MNSTCPAAMSQSHSGGYKARLWPPHLYPAINYSNTLRQRGSQTTKRSTSASASRDSRRPEAIRRNRSLSSSQESRILRSINDIIEFVNSVDGVRAAVASSDEDSTCDSQQRNGGRQGTSKLVDLLAERLHEIRSLHLSMEGPKTKVGSIATNRSKEPHAYANVATSCDRFDIARVDRKPGVGFSCEKEFYTAVRKVPLGATTLYKRPVVNITYANADMALVKAAARRMRWETCESTGGGDIFWFSSCLNGSTMKEQSRPFFGITYKKVTINRFPDIQGAARKALFACLTNIYDKYTEDCPYLYSEAACPKTFLFPRGHSKVVRTLRAGVPMIIKPSAGSMGNGIRVITSPEQIPPAVARGSQYICQVYIARPMLMGGRKFDFRLYLLITNVGGGFHAFLSKLGIVRVCIHAYKRPDAENCADSFMHLTNYSINRHHEKFQRSVDLEDDIGHKRTLRSALETLNNAHGVDVDDVWRQMSTLSEAAASILYPAVQLNAKGSDAYSFQIIGLDMLLDEKGKMWLLEVNANPSLQCTYHDNNTLKHDVVDEHVKVSLVAECLKLVHRLRCGGLNEEELEMWTELRVRIPPEIGEITALYAEYRSKYPGEDMECEEWMRFCKESGLTAALRDSIQKFEGNAENNKKLALQSAKQMMKNAFVRTHTLCKVNGFCEFFAHMEVVAAYIFHKNKRKFLEETDALSHASVSPSDGRNERCDHHNVWPPVSSPTSETKMGASAASLEALEGVSEEDARLIVHLTWLYGGYSMRSRNKVTSTPKDASNHDGESARLRGRGRPASAKTGQRRTPKAPAQHRPAERKPRRVKPSKRRVAKRKCPEVVEKQEPAEMAVLEKAAVEEDSSSTTVPARDGMKTPQEANENYQDTTDTCSTYASTIDEFYYDYFEWSCDTLFLDRRRPRWANGLTLRDKINKFVETGVAVRTEVCDGTPTTLSICNQFELSNHEAMVADVDRVHYYRAAIFWSGHSDIGADVRQISADTIKDESSPSLGEAEFAVSGLSARESEENSAALKEPYVGTRCNSVEPTPIDDVKPYCADKRVLEIGTGPMCVLAMNALNAGAKFVDALEVSSSAARLASKLMAAYGVADKIRVFNCHSKNFFFDAATFFGLTHDDDAGKLEVELPEDPPYDMIISEILGDFCSQEGVADVFLDIQRRILFNKPEYFKKVKSIPTAASTMFVPCVFPDADNVVNKAVLHEEMTIFSPTLKMLQSVGLRIDNLPLCAEWQPMEHLRFEEWMQPQMCQHFESTFSITSSGPMCGFLVGIDVEIRPNERFGTKFGHCESWYSNVLLFEREHQVYPGDVILTRSVSNLTNYVTSNCLGDKIQVSRPSYSVRSYIISPIKIGSCVVESSDVFVYDAAFESRRTACPCISGHALQPVTSVPVAALSQLCLDVVNITCLEPDDWLENYQWVRLAENLYKIRVRPPVITIDYKEQTSATFAQVPSAKRKLPTDPPRRYKRVKARVQPQ